MAATQTNPLVGKAEQVNANTALAAGGTYLSLRLINAALSTAQEIEVSASVGVGGSAQPLKVLEPIDDTVERAANVVFALALVTGTLAVGLGPVAAIGAGVAAAACAAKSLGLQQLIWNRAIALGLVTALALPGAFWIGGGLADLMTREARSEAQQSLDEITATARGLVQGDSSAEPAAETSGDDGWAITRFLSNSSEAVAGVRDALGRYTASVSYFLSNAEVLFNALLVLLGGFFLQTILLPMLLLGFAWALIRR